MIYLIVLFRRFLEYYNVQCYMQSITTVKSLNISIAILMIRNLNKLLMNMRCSITPRVLKF